MVGLVKEIYFVTVFYIPHELLDQNAKEKPEGWSSHLYKRSRCWGWFEKEQDAEQCIKENWTDIYECGYYNLAMIEVMGQGPCNINPDQDRWFKAEYVSGSDKYFVNEIDRPHRFKHICGFSYA